MIDVVMDIDELPVRGGDVRSSRRLVTPGGGFNVMSAARRQGAPARYVGQLGTGHFADVARGALEHEGIEIAVVARSDEDLGVCLVLVDASGERTFVTSPGAELVLRAADLDAVSLVCGDVVYLSGYNVLYPEVATTVSHWLQGVSADVVVAFDPGPRAADIDANIMSVVLHRTDWLVCNAAEARFVSGLEDVVDAARTLRQSWHCDLVVVRDGHRGCVGVGDRGAVRAASFTTNVVDTNGAGDVHNGVLIAELLNATPVEDALVRANAAAAIAISTFGPATCPTRDRVDALVSSTPRRVTRR
jgi:sugar/nucleoside kinase (ribokinase family)